MKGQRQKRSPVQAPWPFISVAPLAPIPSVFNFCLRRVSPPNPEMLPTGLSHGRLLLETKMLTVCFKVKRGRNLFTLLHQLLTLHNYWHCTTCPNKCCQFSTPIQAYKFSQLRRLCKLQWGIPISPSKEANCQWHLIRSVRKLYLIPKWPSPPRQINTH